MDQVAFNDVPPRVSHGTCFQLDILGFICKGLRSYQAEKKAKDRGRLREIPGIDQATPTSGVVAERTAFFRRFIISQAETQASLSWNSNEVLTAFFLLIGYMDFGHRILILED